MEHSNDILAIHPTEDSGNSAIIDLRNYMNSLLISACTRGDLTIEHLCSMFNPKKETIKQCIKCCMKMNKKNHCLILIFLADKYSLFNSDIINALQNLSREMLTEACFYVSSIELTKYMREQIVSTIFPSLCLLKMENNIYTIYHHLNQDMQVLLAKEILSSLGDWTVDFANKNLEMAQINKMLLNDTDLLNYWLKNKREDMLLLSQNANDNYQTILRVICNDVSQWSVTFINATVRVNIKTNKIQTESINLLIESNIELDKETISDIINKINWGSELHNILQKFIVDIINLNIPLHTDLYNKIQANRQLIDLFNTHKKSEYYLASYSFDDLMKIIVTTQNPVLFEECITKVMSKHNEISSRKLRFYNHPLNEPENDKPKMELNDDIIRNNYNKIIDEDPLAYVDIVRYMTTFSKKQTMNLLSDIINNPLLSAVSEYDAFELLKLVKTNFELGKQLIESHDFFDVSK